MPIANRSPVFHSWLARLRQERAIAVIRAPSLSQGLWMAAAVADAGMNLIEITWNSEQPGQLIETLRIQHPQCQIGVGTVLSPQDLKDAIAAGAQFAFCPHTDPKIIAIANRQNCPIIPGALSPSEILTAWQAGADSVKVFPASLGGATYIKNLQGPLGQVPYVPTGGISQQSAIDYLNAGAVAVGIASCLFQSQFLENQDWKGLAEHIRQFRAMLQPIEYPKFTP